MGMVVNFSQYYQPKPKQVEAHKCRAKYLLYAGGLGSGKSYFLCAEVIKNAMKYAGNRIVILRKELSVMRRTILITFKKLCPPEIIKSENQTNLTFELINGSVIIFMEANLSTDPTLNKIRGLEIGFFAIDEANEVAFEVYQILKTRLRWVLPNGEKPRYEGRLTSNPEPCWLIPTFIQSKNENEVFIKAVTTDNYDENSEYVENLKEAFKDNPNLLRKYLYGDWSLIDTINQLIPSEVILKASNRIQGIEITSLGVDVARYGDDRTVFVVLKDGNIELIETHPKTAITEVVTRAIQLIHNYNIDPNYVGIDSVGLGAGVVDSLKMQGYDVVELQGGAKSEETTYEEAFKPYNLRSQMYYELRKDLINGEIGNLTDEGLKLELQALKYEVYSDKTVKVASKDAIKKLLGRSPDIADSLVYANWVKTYRGASKYLPAISGGW